MFLFQKSKNIRNLFQQREILWLGCRLKRTPEEGAHLEKMNNKRKHTRIPIDIVLEDIFALDAFVTKESGRISNISLGGIAFISPSKYKLNTNLVFSFRLPNKMGIKSIHGQVVWVNKSEETEEWKYGIKFTQYGFFNYLKLVLFLRTLKKNAV